MIEFHAEKIHNVLHVEVVADMNGTDALPLVEKLYLLHNQHSPLVRIGISAIYSDSGTAVPIIPSVCSACNSITLLVSEFLECRAQNKKNCKTCYCVTGVPLVELGSPNSEAVSSPSGVPFNEWQTRARDYKSSELDEVALVGS